MNGAGEHGEECLAHHGYACRVCDLRFEERYGEIGHDFIHVHHTTPLSQVAGNPDYRLNPVKDLVAGMPELPRHAPPVQRRDTDGGGAEKPDSASARSRIKRAHTGLTSA